MLESLAAYNAAFQHQKEAWIRKNGWLTNGHFIELGELDALNAAFQEFSKAHSDRAPVDRALGDFRIVLGRSMDTIGRDMADFFKSAWREMDHMMPAQALALPTKFAGYFGQHPLYSDPETFACGDCISFQGNLARPSDASVPNRCWSVPEDVAASVGRLNMEATRVNAETIPRIAQAVIENKFGICTTFAIAAAHLLLEADREGAHRIEVVAFKNHCYVIVNREREDDEEGLFDFTPRMWANDTFVVDPWLGSLGHASIYETYASYPYDYFFRQIQTRFTSGGF